MLAGLRYARRLEERGRQALGRYDEWKNITWLANGRRGEDVDKMMWSWPAEDEASENEMAYRRPVNGGVAGGRWRKRNQLPQ